jgi:hypothetical protein
MTTSTARRALRWAAILGTVPYLGLKAAWLAGSTVGVVDTATFADGSVYALNAATAAMDVVAIVLALALTHDWGQRVPAFLALVPIWVGTGFLVPIALLLPFMELSSPRSFLEPWVQPLVYAGFAWQGVVLAVAFVLYARTRWPGVFRLRTAEVPRGPATRTVLAHLGALLGAAAAVRMLTGGTRSEVLLRLLAAAGVVGAVVMAHRVPGRFWVPVAVTWVGAGSMFAWGLWAVVNTAGATALARDGGVPWQAATSAAAGCLIGVASLMPLSACASATACRAVRT